MAHFCLSSCVWNIVSHRVKRREKERGNWKRLRHSLLNDTRWILQMQLSYTFLLNIVELWLVVVVVVSVNFLSRQVCLFVCLLVNWCTKYGSKVALLYEPYYSWFHTYLYIWNSSLCFFVIQRVLWISAGVVGQWIWKRDS